MKIRASSRQLHVTRGSFVFAVSWRARSPQQLSFQSVPAAATATIKSLLLRGSEYDQTTDFSHGTTWILPDETALDYDSSFFLVT